MWIESSLFLYRKQGPFNPFRLQSSSSSPSFFFQQLNITSSSGKALMKKGSRLTKKVQAINRHQFYTYQLQRRGIKWKNYWLITMSETRWKSWIQLNDIKSIATTQLTFFYENLDSLISYATLRPVWNWADFYPDILGLVLYEFQNEGQSRRSGRFGRCFGFVMIRFRILSMSDTLETNPLAIFTETTSIGLRPSLHLLSCAGIFNELWPQKSLNVFRRRVT